MAFATAATGSSAGDHRAAALDLYTGVVSSEQVAQLVRQGFDVGKAASAAGGVRVDLVLTQAEVAKLAAHGIDVKPVRDKQGRTQAERAEVQAAAGYTVWRSTTRRTASATSSTRSLAGTRRS
jgi:hypothetical protein